MTETKTKTPAAEIFDTFTDALKNYIRCTDGRTLFEFNYCAVAGYSASMFVLAVSELLAWKAMHEKLGVMKKMTGTMLAERTRLEYLKLTEGKTDGTKTQSPTES